MSEAQLQVRGDIQIQLAQICYELRRIRRTVEKLTLDRPPNELEQGVLDHATKAVKGVRLAQDHLDSAVPTACL